MSEATVDATLDTCGKCCPVPMVETNKAIKALEVGQVLEVIATDVGTRTDIPSWCARTGQTLVSMSEENGVLRYHVRREQ
jgi:tRNA 2-thiouridine synthesizing protein A